MLLLPISDYKEKIITLFIRANKETALMMTTTKLKWCAKKLRKNY